MENKQLSFEDTLLENYKIKKPIRLIELFAGIGSQAKALQNIGANFERYRICEFDKYAVASYNAIHNTNFEVSDITKIHANDLGIVDTDKYEYIMTYSFPCQDLSLAGDCKGMNKEDNTRSGLLWEVERLLNECDELPQILIMENVKQVHSKRNIPNFNKWIKFLESKGYSNYWKDLNAKDYGVPQNRERCFMISIFGKYNYSLPLKQELKFRMKDLLEFKVENKYYINSNKHNIKIINNLNSEIEPILLGGIGEKNSNNGRQYKFQNRIYSTETVSVAIAASSFRPNYLCGLHIRKLTPRECWRLMGFYDEDFEKANKVNSNSQLYKQAGNSIVVNVLMAIFKEFL